MAARYRRAAAEEGEGWYVPRRDAFLDQWGVTDSRLRALVGPRLTDFPLHCAVEPTEVDPAPLARVRTVYVSHSDPPLASLQRSSERAVVESWERHELRCGQDMMLVAPIETVDLLERIAGG